MKMEESVRILFPADMQWILGESGGQVTGVREIRMRAERPVIIRTGRRDYFIDAAGRATTDKKVARGITTQEMDRFFMHVCNDSPYAYEDALRQGFLTVAGGHRIGVCGETILDEKGEIRTIRHIHYINIRIAHQVVGAASAVLPYVYEKGVLKNVLIVSPPGCGKTTMLRDLVRQISNGNSFCEGMDVAVVDERSELAGCFMGTAQNDLGMRTDVLDSCPKAKGMMMLLRSMAPQVLAVDEIGGEEDFEAIREATACGCKVIATAHGVGPKDIERRFVNFSGYDLFECIIVLGSGGRNAASTQIYTRDEKGWSIYETIGGAYDPFWVRGTGKPVPQQAGSKAEGDLHARADSGAVCGRDTIWENNPSGELPDHCRACERTL